MREDDCAEGGEGGGGNKQKTKAFLCMDNSPVISPRA